MHSIARQNHVGLQVFVMVQTSFSQRSVIENSAVR